MRRWTWRKEDEIGGEREREKVGYVMILLLELQYCITNVGNLDDPLGPLLICPIYPISLFDYIDYIG